MQMMPRRSVIVFLAILLPFFIKGQEVQFEGKTIAVYFSKKNFTFHDEWRQPLMQFVKAADGEDVDIEDLKRQTIVLLGSLFSSQLAAGIDADSAFFVNENPEMAVGFIAAYDAGSRSVGKPLALLKAADYVLVINPLDLGTYETNSVYVRSNRIINDRNLIRLAEMGFDLFETASGRKIHAADFCYDEKKSTGPDEVLFDFTKAESPSAGFLANLFSLAVENLMTGKEVVCSEE